MELRRATLVPQSGDPTAPVAPESALPQADSKMSNGEESPVHSAFGGGGDYPKTIPLDGTPESII